MLWLPWVRRIDQRFVQFVLALTVGLLGFLGIDALLEGTEIAATGAEAFGGAALVWLGAVVAYLALAGVDGWLRARRERASGCRCRGRLAAGRCSSRSASACTTSARVWRSARRTPSGRSRSGPRWWSASPCTTPPRAWPSSPPSRRRGARPALRRLALLGLVAGAPAILGAFVGASAFDPSLAAFMFGLGAGAIAQVIVQIAPTIRDGSGRLLHPLAVGGLLTGLALMYVTGLLISL